MASLITADPAILGGKPIIRGTRISVDFILELYAPQVFPGRRSLPIIRT
jgi:uncharacterized protein (DUF433 family)